MLLTALLCIANWCVTLHLRPCYGVMQNFNLQSHTNTTDSRDVYLGDLSHYHKAESKAGKSQKIDSAVEIGTDRNGGNKG